MQGEFDGVMEDVAPDDASGGDDEEGDEPQELDNEMGDTGDTGEVRLTTLTTVFWMLRWNVMFCFR